VRSTWIRHPSELEWRTRGIGEASCSERF
jgi:hypothetical protein